MLFGPLSSWFSLSHSFLTFWILPKTAFKIKNNRHLTRKCAGRQRNRNEIFSFQWLISSTSLAEFPFHGWKTAHPYSFCCTKPCVIQNLGKTPEDSAHWVAQVNGSIHIEYSWYWPFHFKSYFQNMHTLGSTLHWLYSLWTKLHFYNIFRRFSKSKLWFFV